MLSYLVVLSSHILVCGCNFGVPVSIRGQVLEHICPFLMPLCPWCKGPFSVPTYCWGIDMVQSILGLWATQGSRAAGSSCLLSFWVCREIALARGCSWTVMIAKHSPGCLHLPHCTYTLYISELPAALLPPPAVHTTVGTMPVREGSSLLPPWCPCQLLSVSFSLSLYCSNETAQLLLAWQQ